MVDIVFRLRNHAVDSAEPEYHTAEQERAKVNHVLLRQLRAVAMTEQCRDRDVSYGVYLHFAMELFQGIIGTRQPILHIPCYRQEVSPIVLEWLRTIQKSCTP